MNKTAKLALLLFVTLGMVKNGLAQADLPAVEIFGGFSYLPAGPDDFPRGTSYGFQGSVTANLNRWFGIVGDFGGQYDRNSNLGPGFAGIIADVSVYEFLAGPRFTARSPRTNAFAHFLIGGASGRTNLGGFSDSELTIGAGGGLDIHLTRRISIRTFQLDYIGSFTDMIENNMRLGSGIVIRLGGS